MTSSLRWTSRDLEVLPENGKRYEIIDGELYVTKQPHYYHQDVCSNLVVLLGEWSLRTGAGTVPIAPGLIFAEDEDVAPDVVWVSAARLPEILGSDGHLHGAPELVIEVLSPDPANARRDRETKVKLYSRRGVDEYWIVDWQAHVVDVYRRSGEALEMVDHLAGDAVIQSPLLPGFAGPLARVFTGVA